MVWFLLIEHINRRVLYFTVYFLTEDLIPFIPSQWINRCDRILWYGNGLNQLSYVRGESRFSDHRPVYSVFLAEVEIIHQRRKNMGYFSSRIEVEELLPHSRSYRERSFY
jgi:hypothetical protein